MYAWGTSAKGTIPLPEIIDGAVNGSSGGGILSSSGQKFDVPRKVDTQNAFAVEGKSISGIKQMVC